jgi:hypothetical protein
MTRTKGSPKDLRLLGRELRLRGFTVYAHPDFGGVTPGAHDPKGAHYRPGGEAVDVGRDKGGPVSAHEQMHMDRLAVELDARRFAVIWWRGPGDHQDHLHAATSNWRGAPGYRFGAARSRQNCVVSIDGLWGPKTWAALSWALNRDATPGLHFSRQNPTTRALQAVINTEAGRELLELDGALGPRTWTALGELLGVRAEPRPTTALSSVTAVLQLHLHALGRVV